MKMSKQKFSATVLAGIVLTIPFMVSAASSSGLVPCGGAPGDTYNSPTGPQPSNHDCGFNDLSIMANTIIHFLMYDVAVPLAALGFMYVGGNLILNQDKPHAWITGKERFWDIGKGFAIMIGAFLLIKLILAQFLADGFSASFLLN
jgi:hypothetical protein